MTSAKMFLIPALAGLAVLGSACSSSSSPSKKISYSSCADVKAAGKAPLHKGDPGYSSKLDGDGDGTACDAARMTMAECQRSAEYPGGRYAVSFDNGVCTVQRP